MANAEVDVYERLNGLALPASERNAIVSFDELVQADTVAEIPNPYRVVENKDELIGVPFYVREVVLKPAEESDNDAPYAILYCVTEREMVIVTDGGTGIYRFIADRVQARLDAGEAEPTQGFYFPNGVRKSEYATLDGKALSKGSKEKPNGKGVTYYFA